MGFPERELRIGHQYSAFVSGARAIRAAHPLISHSSCRGKLCTTRVFPSPRVSSLAGLSKGERGSGQTGVQQRDKPYCACVLYVAREPVVLQVSVRASVL